MLSVLDMVQGSSPLARGLREKYSQRICAPRIIPARAGFTRRALRVGRLLEDHPRSRGVYIPVFIYGGFGDGSSPLARGLRDECLTWIDLTRIIPARAGFTVGCSGGRGFGWDHPRSRGVYRRRVDQASAVIGSSPLARGLRSRFYRCRWTMMDHPRSRGVYTILILSPSAQTGSSPLARGLRGHIERLRERPGIIPARAGFTFPQRADYRHPRDHPRSRGVYHKIQDSQMETDGSSPLARGLPAKNVCVLRISGIIPARAGFTGTMMLGVMTTSDHPRSRGVYPWRPSAMAVWRGSSPLARGLRAHFRFLSVPCRIIPARAGFTPGPL